MGDIYVIRDAIYDDIRNVFELSNKEYVRRYSISKEEIKWESHVKWFSSMLKDEDKVFHIVEGYEGEFYGQVRYTIVGNKATVGISLSELILGKGLSKKILSESIEILSQDYAITGVIAYVYEKNTPSKKLFEGVGFEYCDSDNGLIRYRFGVDKSVYR